MRAKKSLGQHFLQDREVIARIIEAVDPQADETIVEIGPGHGALTSSLLERAGRVIAIEIDRDLAKILRARFGDRANFALIERDALALDYCAIIAPATRARVVANLPYNISTAIVQRLIEDRACLGEMVLMLQREVVWRMVAPAGARERGYLSVLIEAYCEAERLFDVPPRAFRPVPKVWSTVIRLRSRPQMAISVSDEDFFWRLVKIGFMQRRKTILNNLRRAEGEIGESIARVGGPVESLALAGIDARRRAETLTLEEWARLAHVLLDARLD
jgi:16S rRNA (adenine1518-N6/adenine1519-N6)-dimethyltransferase